MSLRDIRIWPAWAGLGGLVAACTGAASHPLLALGLPVALLAGLVLFSSPFAGVLALTAFSHLDAIEKALFGFLPISAFKLITASLGAILLLRGWQFRNQLCLLLRDPVTTCAMLTIGCACVSAVFAADKSRALSAIQDFASLFFLMSLIVAFTDTRKRLVLLIYTLVATSLVSALLLLLDIATGLSFAHSEAATTARTAEGFDRSSGGSDQNPTTAAAMLLTGVVFALVHFLERRQLRGVAFCVVSIGTLAVILSFARSAVVAYALILIALFWRYRRERFIPLALICTLFGLLLALPVIPPQYWDRLASILGTSSNDWTLGRRLTYNLIGLDLLARHPFVGVGPGNFPHYFVQPEYRFLPGRTLYGRELHNMYMSMAVQLGMGSLPFFAMIGYALSRLRAVIHDPADDQMRVIALALAYGVVAFLITCIFMPSEFTKYPWLLSAICAVTYHINLSERSKCQMATGRSP
ncbi:MAG: O-antigen ligase family protein [Pseudomonadota bacterium]